MVPGARRPCPPFRRRPPELSGVRTRYFSPFPKDVFDFTEKNEPKSIRMLYFDEFGLKAFLRREQLARPLVRALRLQPVERVAELLRAPDLGSVSAGLVEAYSWLRRPR